MFPKPINVTLRYDAALQAITGRASDPVVLSDGAPFNYLLFNLFQSYPKIEQQFPPGTLGFAVNGKRPSDDTVLRDGDVVEFVVVEPPALKSPKELILTEEAIRRELRTLVERYQLSHTVEAIEELIFEEKEAKDFPRYLETIVKGARRQPANLDEMNRACELLSRAWNELPHASLDGQSPAQFAATFRAKAQRKPATKQAKGKRKRG